METVEGMLDDILQDLDSKDFKKFQWWLALKVLDECKPIPKGQLENLSREDTASLMVRRYGEDEAVKLSLKIYESMSLNNIKDKLKRAYEGKFPASSASSSASSSAASAPVAASSGASVTMSAQHGSLVVSPTLNINVQHP